MKIWQSALGAGALGVAVPAAAQQAPTLEFAFEETVSLGEATSPGDTARGGRLIIPITGGTFEGPGIRGTVMPGGWDWQINVVNTGVICRGESGELRPVRTHPVFEAPRGKYEWLSQAAFVGTLEPAPPAAGPAVKIRFYRVR